MLNVGDSVYFVGVGSLFPDVENALGTVVAEACHYQHPTEHLKNHHQFLRVRLAIGGGACVHPCHLRKIDGDGRQLVRWDYRTLGKPSRSLVEA